MIQRILFIMTKIILSGIPLLLVPLYGHAQQFLNLGFEYERRSNEPAQWQVINGTLSLDSGCKYSGNYAARLTGDTINSFTGCMQSFNDLSGLTGKTLEIRCKAKCNTEDTSKIQIWAACFEKDVLQSGVNGDSLTGKTVWSDLSAKIEINTQTTAVLFGVTGSKGATFYLDEFEILVNGDLYKDFTPRKEPLDGRERKWLDKHVYPFDSLTTDFEELGRAVGNARIVGLGEATHGAGTVTMTRNQLAKYLIKEKGFTMLALENSLNVIEAIDRFVSTGEGSIENILKQTFNWSNNQEFAELILWIREYNKNADKKVRIEGVDMQDFSGILGRLNEMSEGQFYQEIIHPVDSIIRYVDSEHRRNKGDVFSIPIHFTEEQRTIITASMSRLRQWAEKEIPERELRNRFLWYTNIVEQYMEMDTAPRNRFIADNVVWLSKQNPDTKILFFAHNSHVGKGSSVTDIREAGDHLRERFGNDYYVIGTCFYQGTYMAGNIYKNNRYMAVSANPGMPGSYEYLFESLKKPYIFLNWRNIPKTKENAWLFQPMLFRIVGGIWNNNEYYPFPLTERFDAIVFMETTLPTNPLRDIK